MIILEMEWLSYSATAILPKTKKKKTQPSFFHRSFQGEDEKGEEELRVHTKGKERVRYGWRRRMKEEGERAGTLVLLKKWTKIAEKI